MTTLVLFHRHCIDGFASAFVWWKKNGDADHTYRSYQSGEYLNTEEFDRFVFLDCSPKARDVRKILKSKKAIVLIDHHRMATETLDRLYNNEKGQFEKVMFDENRAAAPMVAEYLQLNDENVSKLLTYIEDRDLSRFDLDKTREVSIAISNLPKEFREWDKMFANWDKVFNELLISGETLMRYQETIVKIVCKRDYIVYLKHGEDFYIPLINSNLYQSEIGQLLCKLLQCKLAGCFSIRGNMVNVHVRGENADGIAKAYNGNGTYKYAGFMIPLKEFYERLRK